MFLILLSFAWSCTVTLNFTVFVSPAFICTLIPFVNWLCVISGFSSPSISTLPLIKLVPVGTVSFTVTSAGAVPVLLSNVIVYVIVCPSTTFPFAGTAVLCAITFALFTVLVISPVGFPSTVAVFLISLVKLSPCKGLTVTSKLMLAFPCAGIFTSIPLFKFVSV